MREGRCISLIERLKQGSELKSTLVSKISNLSDPDRPTWQRHGQTDGRHAISIPRNSASRGNKIKYDQF